MQLNLRFQFQAPELAQRILDRLRPHGEMTRAAQAIGLSPSRLTNVLRGYCQGVPLGHILSLEAHLSADLLGSDRAAIVAELRAMADRVERSASHPSDS